ncbi:MAG TPA: hypothetical protein VJZ93_02610 [Candidatus Nanoarchaeia archaeon]|nr:hypothetical protein [Candidatus Nanoarchaeia archaeon]
MKSVEKINDGESILPHGKEEAVKGVYLIAGEYTKDGNVETDERMYRATGDVNAIAHAWEDGLTKLLDWKKIN